MTHQQLAATALVAIALAFAAANTAKADRPLVSAHPSCKSFIHGKSASARKLSKAKKRARRKWQTRALGRAGFRFRKWEWARHRHYDCTKKGRRHHCMAAAYPCPRFVEAIGPG